MCEILLLKLEKKTKIVRTAETRDRYVD